MVASNLQPEVIFKNKAKILYEGRFMRQLPTSLHPVKAANTLTMRLSISNWPNITNENSDCN